MLKNMNGFFARPYVFKTKFETNSYKRVIKMYYDQ